MRGRSRARVLAFQALYAMYEGNTDLAGALEFAWLDDIVDDEIKVFAGMLIQGTCDHIDEIDAEIKKKLQHWDFSRLVPVDLAILRLSVYAIIFRKEIPKPVTINEAVEIAKKYGSDKSYKFVNGILDNIE